MSELVKIRRGPSLRRSWTIQRQVIWALLMREILTRYGRHNIGFLWLFVEPMMFTLGVTALWTATKAVHGSDLAIVAFAITGYSSVLLWRNMPSRCIDALEPNLSLLYHRNVKVMDIYTARILLEAAGATMSFVFLALFFTTIGWMDPPENLLEVIGAWLLTAWFGGALAILLGSLATASETIHKLWHPLSYILFPLSGAGILVDALPREAQDVILYLPMVHGVEFLREGYFGSQIVAHYNLGYMIGCNILLTLLGLSQLRRVSAYVVPE